MACTSSVGWLVLNLQDYMEIPYCFSTLKGVWWRWFIHLIRIPPQHLPCEVFLACPDNTEGTMWPLLLGKSLGNPIVIWCIRLGREMSVLFLEPVTLKTWSWINVQSVVEFVFLVCKGKVKHQQCTETSWVDAALHHLMPPYSWRKLWSLPLPPH